MTQRVKDFAPELPAPFGRPPGGMRARVYAVIFESDTEAGRRFDKLLVAAIMLSILVVVLDSVPEVTAKYGRVTYAIEWTFTALFTIEYVARLWCVQRPLRYARSFYGMVDLLAVLPTYFSLLVPGSALLLDIRILRLLRVFRIFKLTLYVEEFTRLGEALYASRRKIMVFLSAVLMAVLVLGTLMYVIEGPHGKYTSIPMSMYWAIVTMTTVGYGDITPQTDLGKLIASFMMLLGWGILAVPTGIVTAEMTSQRLSRRRRERTTDRACSDCGTRGHEPGARYCKDCGASLARNEAPGG